MATDAYKGIPIVPVPELGYGKAVIVERLTTEEIRKLIREELEKAKKRP